MGPVGSEGAVLAPGDIIEVSVWKEPDLQKDALLRPDGAFTFPLAGDVVAKGGEAIDPRGGLYTEANIGERLAQRNM